MILVGSTYFFKDYPDFNSKDTDYILVVDNPVSFKIKRQTHMYKKCIFEWNRLTPKRHIQHLKCSNTPMELGKFLVPEFCKEIGFTITDLKKCEFVLDKLDDKHKYLVPIYNAYIKNNAFILDQASRDEAYKIYKEARNED